MVLTVKQLWTVANCTPWVNPPKHPWPMDFKQPPLAVRSYDLSLRSFNKRSQSQAQRMPTCWQTRQPQGLDLLRLWEALLNPCRARGICCGLSIFSPPALARPSILHLDPGHPASGCTWEASGGRVYCGHCLKAGWNLNKSQVKQW